MSDLPSEYAARKGAQLWDFQFGYFPDAWLAVADVAIIGNAQHNPGEPLHWAREKSNDQLNCAFRHLFDYAQGKHLDIDGARHLAKAIWRLMAQCQLDIERDETREPREMTLSTTNRTGWVEPTNTPIYDAELQRDLATPSPRRKRARRRK